MSHNSHIIDISEESWNLVYVQRRKTKLYAITQLYRSISNMEKELPGLLASQEIGHHRYAQLMHRSHELKLLPLVLSGSHKMRIKST